MPNVNLSGLYFSNINFNSATHISFCASYLNHVVVVPSSGCASFFKAIKAINTNAQCYILLDPSINTTDSSNLGQYLPQSPVASNWYIKGNLIPNVATTILPNVANSYYQDFGSASYQNYYPSVAMQLRASMGAQGIILNDMPWQRNFQTVYPTATTITASIWSGASSSATYISGFDGLSAYNNFLTAYGSIIGTKVSIFSNTLNNYIDLQDGSLSDKTAWDLLSGKSLNIITDNNFYQFPTYYNSELFNKTLSRENNAAKSDNFYIQIDNVVPSAIQTSLQYNIAANLLENVGTGLYFQPGYYGTASGSGYDLDYTIRVFPSYQNLLTINIGTTLHDKEVIEYLTSGEIYHRSFSNANIYVNNSDENYIVNIATLVKDYLTTTKYTSSYSLSAKSAAILQSATGLFIDYSGRYTVTEFGQALQEHLSDNLYAFLDHTHTDAGIAPTYVNVGSHVTGLLDPHYIDSIDISKISDFEVDWNRINQISHIGRVNEPCEIYKQVMLADASATYTKYYAPETWDITKSIHIFKNGNIISNYVAYPESAYITLPAGFSTFFDIISISYDDTKYKSKYGAWGVDSAYDVYANGSNKNSAISSAVSTAGIFYFNYNPKLSDNITITINEGILKDKGLNTHPEIDDIISEKDSYLPYDISNILISNTIANMVSSYIPTHRTQLEILNMADMYEFEEDVQSPIIPLPDNVPTWPGNGFYGPTYRIGQTFVSEGYTIGGARTYLSKTGTLPYNIYCSIFENGYLGFPTSNLATAMINSTYIPSISPSISLNWTENIGKWVEFKTPTIIATSSKQYSVVLSTTATSHQDDLYWWISNNDYKFGNSIQYTGASWLNEDFDRVFQTLEYVPSSYYASGIYNTEKLAQIFPAKNDSIRMAGLSLRKIGTASYLVNISLCGINATRIPLDTTLIIASKSINSNNIIPSNINSSNFYTEFIFDNPITANIGQEYALVLSSESSSITDLIYWNAYNNIYPEQISAVKRTTWSLQDDIDRAYFIEPENSLNPISLYNHCAVQTFVSYFDTIKTITLNLNKIDNRLQGEGSDLSNYNVYLNLYTVDANNFPLTVIATINKNVNSIIDGDNVFNFNNFSVTPKRLYALKLSQNGGDQNHNVAWSARNDNINLWGKGYVGNYYYVGGVKTTTYSPLPNNNDYYYSISNLDSNNTIDDAYENYGNIATNLQIPSGIKAMQTFYHSVGIATQANLTIWGQLTAGVPDDLYVTANLTNLSAGIPDNTSIIGNATYAAGLLDSTKYLPAIFNFNLPTQLNVGTYGFILNHNGGISGSFKVNIGLTNYNSKYNTYSYTSGDSTSNSISNYTIPFEFHAVGNYIDELIGTDDPDEPEDPIIRKAAQTFTNNFNSITEVKLFMSKDIAGSEVPITFKICGVDGSNLPDLSNVLYSQSFTSFDIETDGAYKTFDLSRSPLATRPFSVYSLIVELYSSNKGIYWWSSNVVDPGGIAYNYVNNAWSAVSYDRAYIISGVTDVTDPDRLVLPSYYKSSDLEGKWQGKDVAISILIDNTGSLQTNDPTNIRFDAVKKFLTDMNTLLGSSVIFDISLFQTMQMNYDISFEGYIAKKYTKYLDYNVRDVNNYIYMLSLLGDSSNMTNNNILINNYIDYINNNNLFPAVGATPIVNSINNAIDRLIEQNIPNGKTYNKEKIIIVFTDGIENMPYDEIELIENLSEKVFNKLKQNNIKIYMLSMFNNTDLDRTINWYFTDFNDNINGFENINNTWTSYGANLTLQTTYDINGVLQTLPASPYSSNYQLSGQAVLNQNGKASQSFTALSDRIKSFTFMLAGDNYSPDNKQKIKLSLVNTIGTSGIPGDYIIRTKEFEINNLSPGLITVNLDAYAVVTPGNVYSVILEYIPTTSNFVSYQLSILQAITNSITGIADGRVFSLSDVSQLTPVFDYIRSSGEWIYDDYYIIQDFGEDAEIVSLKVELVLNEIVNIKYTVEYKESKDTEWKKYNNLEQIIPNPFSTVDKSTSFIARYVKYNIYFS